MMKKMMMFMASVIIATFAASHVSAHMLWLNANKYAPKTGETVYIEIGFGHQYPREELVKPGRMEAVYAIAPDGEKIDLEKVFPSFYKFTPKSKGTYLIMGAFKSGFVSKTTDGRIMGNKKTLENVVSCFAFRMTASALINCGGSGGDTEIQSDEDLQIVAMKNPEDLKPGDSLPVKVLFKNEPLADAEIKATCQLCETGKDSHWVHETKSDSKGMANIRLSTGGPWVFFVSHKIPYSDPEICDDQSYRTSLTLGL
jgi:uncharacterized GH25 family protein